MNDQDFLQGWTLEGLGGSVAAGEAGVTEIVRRRTLLRTETCVLKMASKPFDSAPLFPLGSAVTVRREGTVWFAGRAVAAPGYGDGQTEACELTLAGPWWHLENLAYTQTRSLHGGESTGGSSRVVLGRGEAGERLTSGQVITRALQAAIDAGAPLQIGVIEPGLVLPLEELLNVTCAQAIRRVLRWQPECVAWFEHATPGGATFHCRAEASLDAVTLTVGQPPLAEVRGITGRAGAAAPAVVLHYETNGEEGLDVLTDAAPPGATGQEFGALVVTIPAVGGSEAAGEGMGSGGAGGAGLAQALFEARGGMSPYAGEVVLREAMASGAAVGLGKGLNLAGAAQAEWATMRAPVVEEEVRVGEGMTRVRFGSGVGKGS